MATKKATPKSQPEPAMPPPNREQRRREKFGKAGKVHQHAPGDPWPRSDANPALLNTAGDQPEPANGPGTDTAAATETKRATAKSPKR